MLGSCFASRCISLLTKLHFIVVLHLFVHFVFSLLFASFNFTKLQFIVDLLCFLIVTVGLSLILVTVGLSLMIGFHNIYSVLSWFGVLGFIAFTTYSVSCWFRALFQVLGSGCLVLRVLCSRCLVSGEKLI